MAASDPGGTGRPGAGSVAFLASGIGPKPVFALDGLADVTPAPAPTPSPAPEPKPKAATPTPTPTPTPAVEKPVRPEWLPETMWDADKGFKKADFDALSALKAETDSRKASVPEAADKYEAKLPAAFKLPDGVKLKDGESLINADDPRVASLREWAHGKGFTQPEFEELLAFGANMDLAERGRLSEAVGKEREKLGGRSVERIKAVTTWLDAKLGAEDAASLHSMMFTAKQIEAFERLMQLNRGDVPGKPGAGRDAKPAEVSDEEWDKMSTADRINYARQNAGKK